MAKEPQSYGSQKDWVTGNVGGTVNQQKGSPDSRHDDFYDNRRDTETNDGDEGGQVSEHQLAENAQPPERGRSSDDQPARKVTDQATGAKRGGFFKNRDYE